MWSAASVFHFGPGRGGSGIAGMRGRGLRGRQWRFDHGLITLLPPPAAWRTTPATSRRHRWGWMCG